ncbi:GNAT family N-acetyltransferase, partial [Mycobacterium intracellulare]
WQILAGIGPGSALGEDLAEAKESGVLSHALRGGIKHARSINQYANMFDSLCARTLVLSARSGAKTVGLLLLGPPPALLQRGPQFNGQNAAFLFHVAKLGVLAVDPTVHGTGIGSRLVRVGTDIARQSGYLVLYGEFHADRPALPTFYERCGFEVLETDQALNLTEVMGFPTLIKPTGSDRLFVTGLT